MSRVDESKEFPRQKSGTAFREVGEDGGLVVVPKESTVQVLNPVGAKIFSMLDGKHSRAQIVEALVAEFDVDEKQARGDLEAFLQELETAGMLAGSGGVEGQETKE